MLLLLAAALVLAQDDSPRTQRQRQLADRRSKLFEQRKAEQEAVAPAAGQRRRLVSKTRINSARSRTTTEVPTTTTTEAPTTTTEEPFVLTTEPVFAFEPVTFTEEPEVATPEPVRELPAFRPRPRPVKVEEVVQESEEVVQEEVRPVRVRPQAGPSRTRARPRPAVVEQPQEERVVVAEAPVAERQKPRPAKTKEEAKPFVETVRRYSFENEDGSFTFGYENADGSFKEETRGVDCIVRGKYGYVDPDGVKREFTYQTGNPCNRNREEEQEATSEEEVDRPVLPQRRPNIPSRFNVNEDEDRPRRPVNTPRPFVQTVEERPRRPVASEEADEEAEITRVVSIPTRINRPQNAVRVQRPQVTVPAEEAPVRVPEVRRPVQPTQAPQPALPRPVATRPVSGPVDFEAEVQRLAGAQPAPQRPAPRPAVQRPIFDDEDDRDVFERRPAQPDRGTGLRSFTSELVFDRNTNQFQTAFQQRIPETNEEINLREKLLGFVPSTTTARPAAPVTTLATPVVIPTSTARPAANEFFGPSVEEQERFRQEAELRRQQAEAQRLREERQRIQEENERRARPQTPARAPATVQQFEPNTFGFNQPARFQQPQFAPQQPQFAPQQQQFQPQQQQFQPQPFPGQFQSFQNPPQQFQPVNPFAPGLSAQRFGAQPQQQPAQFRAPAAPVTPAPRPIPSGDRPTFALGQIDSFLSSLSG